ncbi:MAG: transcriptional regulator PpsR [Gemmatimonadaceae bacterium]|nr:transcriptional regulator PpsR [Acetobacteraceae bacterium]
MKTFVSPQTSLGDLDAASAAALIAAASDVTLILDPEGLIRDTAFQSAELMDDLDDSAQWVGRAIATTIAADSRTKMQALLTEAMTAAEPKWRHINHLASDGRSVPVLYCGVQVGVGGRIVAFGRDLRVMSALQQRLMNAQQSMERDYSKLRDVEMRYRLLFQLSSEAVLILDPTKLRVLEANPATRDIFGAPSEDIVGHTIGQMFNGESLPVLQAHLAAIRGGARPEDLPAQLTRGNQPVVVKVSLFRQDNATLFLMRISSVAAPQTAATLPDVKAKLLRAVESAPDGFVVTDHEGAIITANAAFLEMAQLANEDLARGQSLDRWVGTNGVDLDVLTSNLRSRGSVRFFSTSVRGEEGSVAQVEISAVSVLNGGHPSFGYAIRNVGPRMQVDTRAARQLPRSVEQLTELIGRVSLKDLVREATEVIERLSIEAALELTNDNRASAAEMLGLSRQSLYVKLRRYGIGDLAAVEPN